MFGPSHIYANNCKAVTVAFRDPTNHGHGHIAGWRCKCYLNMMCAIYSHVGPDETLLNLVPLT